MSADLRGGTEELDEFLGLADPGYGAVEVGGFGVGGEDVGEEKVAYGALNLR